MLKVIAVDELTPGMMITQVVEQHGPVKIRKVGFVRSQDMITGLSEMGVVKVEIDPSQTIEVEVEEAPTSMTQKLLQGEYDHASEVDSNLSDQFNRSLFLPSVNELPSMWQIYMKQAGVVLGVVALGFSLGLAGVLIPAWMAADEPNPVVQVDNTAPTSGPTTPPADTAVTQVADTNPQTSTNTELASVADEARTGETQSAEILTTDTSSDATQPSAQDTIPDDALVLGAVPDTAVSDTAVSDTAVSNTVEQAAAPAEEEGELLTQSPDDADASNVSPELLARINQALEQIESEPAFEEPEARVTVRDDIPRVDELPARLLTQLPTMEFSAHMYASLRANRWVRVNGQQLFEGEWIDNRVQLVNIEPQRVVLSYQGELFTMAALTDW